MMPDYPAKVRYQGEVAVQYDEKRSSSIKWMRENEIICNIVAEFEAGSVILDLPLGTGRFLQYYEKGRHFVIGVDISTDMLLEAKMKSTIDKNLFKLIAGEAEQIPMSDKSIDYVICVRLLNWVPKKLLKHILKEIHRVARKGIIMSIRVRRSVSTIKFIQQCIRDIIPPVNNMQYWLALKIKKAKKYTSILKEKLIRGKTQTRAQKGSSGFNLHEEKELLSIFTDKRMEIYKVNQVDMTVSYSQKELRPYLLYFLRVKE